MAQRPAGRALHALPAGAPRRRSDRRGHRFAPRRSSSIRRKTGCTRRRRCSRCSPAVAEQSTTRLPTDADRLGPTGIVAATLRLMRQVVIPRHGAPDVFEMREVPDPLARRRARSASASARRASTSPTSSPASASIPTRRSRRSSSATRSPASSTPSVPASPASRRRPRRRADALRRLCRLRRRAGGQVFRFPDGLSDAEAAAVPVTYLTAALALYRMAALDVRRDRARPQRRRRPGHRGDAARAAAAGDGDRHGVGGRSTTRCAASASSTPSTTATPTSRRR